MENEGKVVISLTEVIDVIKKELKKLIVIGIVLSILVGLNVFTTPKEYQSFSILLPEGSSKSSLSGSLGALGSIAGLKSPDNESGDDISVELYPTILQTNVFKDYLSKEQIVYSNHKISVSDYFNKHTKTNIISSSLASIKSIFKSSKKLNGEASIYKIKKYTTEELVSMINIENRVKIDLNEETGLLKITALTQDREVSCQLVDLTQDYIVKYVQDYSQYKLSNQIEYLEEELIVKNEDYSNSLTLLAKYDDENKFVVKKVEDVKRRKLLDNVQSTNRIYSLVLEQLEEAKIKRNEAKMVFTEIQPVVYPILPEGLGRSKKFVLYVTLFMSLAVLFFVTKKVVSNLNGIKANSVQL